MKKIFQWLIVAAGLALGSLSAFAGGSNPGLYYGQIPTAAQWNSYFAAKLDYTPGALNTIPYWDGSGNLLNALVSGDCTSANNVFTCTASHATSIAGQTQWGVLYQSASGVTASTAAGSAGQVLTSNGTSAPTYQPVNPLTAFRNRLINGDMSVNQVNGGTAVTPTTNQFITDQWQAIASQASKLTFQQVADAPAGLKYSTKISVAVQYAPVATDNFLLIQKIEGQNIVDFQLGTAGAVTIVTSQWIKGSVAGTYAVALHNSGDSRSYVGTVTVTTAWQRLSISLIGDTTGTWLTDANEGLVLIFDLGSGSNFNTTAGSWQAGNFLRTSGSVTFVNQVAGSTLNITGAQVEAVPAGVTTPTAYEFLPYSEQLLRAQRYLPCWNSTGTASILGSAVFNSTTSAKAVLALPVATRVAVTGVSVSSAAHFNVDNVSAFVASAVGFIGASDKAASASFTVTGATANTGGFAYMNNASGQICFTGAQL